MGRNPSKIPSFVTLVPVPALSILLLCWNHAEYLPACIDSLGGQSCMDFEVVFLDNASTDGSFELASALLERAGIASRLLRNDQPRGIAYNANQLLGASHQELVATLSTDDWFDPGYVEAMLEGVRSYPGAGMYYPGGWFHFEPSGRQERVDDSGFRSGDLSAAILAGETPFFFVGCCYRRSALAELGGWDESQPIEDRDLFLRLSLKHSIQYVPAAQVYYRRSDRTASANPRFMVPGWKAYFAKHRALFGSNYRRQLGAMYRTYAAIAVDRNDLRLAGKLLAKACAADPLQPAMLRTCGYAMRKALRRAIKR